jgi:transketolase
MIKDDFINPRNLKLWPNLGMRASFGLMALELAKLDKKLIILTGDVSTSAGLDRFRKNYPEKYIDVGIAEQNLIGIAAGLSSEGYNVITTTFAPFQTIRCLEQIKVNLGYMNQKVCMVGLASGLVLGNLGYTHCCIEDIGVLRSIPNLDIISPADTTELAKALIEFYNSKNSMYIRLTGGSSIPLIFNNDYEFKLGKSKTLRKGDDVAIISTGSMLKTALDAAEILSKSKITAEVINLSSIKPIDKKKILEIGKKFNLTATIEEHNIIGGLGSAVAECLSSENSKTKQLFFGVDDRYTKGGDYQFLLDKFNLKAEKISKMIIKHLK